ncbi:GNAT family N-acetyltransferase, partial [Staphylococcus gallinarum]|uniref:GNAT family N-acetyltransferase n=2 Tax=Bacillales TaxID=1385 RepID=UPI00317A125F
AYMDTDIVFISHICVLPEAPSGSGHALLEALCEEAVKANKRKIHLHVEATNERAIAFYMRHGFSELDRIDDVLVMESVL